MRLVPGSKLGVGKMNTCRMGGLLLVAAAVLSVEVLAAGEAVQVRVSALQVSRPSGDDPYQMPGMTITLEASVQGAALLGVAPGSAVELLKDDTGLDILAAGSAAEESIQARLAVEWGEDSGGSLASKQTDGHIDLEQANNLVDRERGVVSIPVVTLGLPAPEAGNLILQGSLNLRVAGEGEQSTRLENVTLDPEWGNQLDLDGELLQCSLDNLQSDGTAEVVSGFYCWGANVLRVNVVNRPRVPAEYLDEGGRTNVWVMGSLEDLTLEVVKPVEEVIVVPFSLQFGVGL